VRGGNDGTLLPTAVVCRSQVKLAVRHVWVILTEVTATRSIAWFRGQTAACPKRIQLLSRIAKIAFTGETTTGRLIMQYAAQNSLSADQRHAGELQPEEARLLLMSDRRSGGLLPPDSFDSIKGGSKCPTKLPRPPPPWNCLPK
jgi:hypothetical protein